MTVISYWSITPSAVERVSRYVPTLRESRQSVYDCPALRETVVLMYVTPLAVRVMVNPVMSLDGVMVMSPVFSFK